MNNAYKNKYVYQNKIMSNTQGELINRLYKIKWRNNNNTEGSSTTKMEQIIDFSFINREKNLQKQ